MSKSRYNVTNPDDMCEQFGADSMRLYELFMGPLEEGGMWDDSGVAGTRRFLDRAWRLAENVQDDDVADLDFSLHSAIKKVSEAVESLKFNTAISEMMVFVNEGTKAGAIGKNQLSSFTRILAPFAPHIAEELWASVLGHTESISAVDWPEFDESKLVVDTITIAVQVMGKMRGTIEVSASAGKDEILTAAKALENVAKLIDGKELRREIYVPGRLVNLVV